MSLIAARRALLAHVLPTWGWDCRNGTAPPGSTFTRASAGRYWDITGVLQSAGTNTARFDYDPVTHAPLGYLAEVQSTNACTYSQAIAASWSDAATHVTVTDNAVVAPDGTTTASSFIEDGTTNAHFGGGTPVNITNGSVYGYSAFMKNISGSRWFQMNLGGGDYINFQPSTGTIGSMSAKFSSASVRAVGNSFYRVSGFFTAASTTATEVRVYMVNASNSAAAASYAGDGASGFAVWGVQFETAGVGVTSYIPTAGSTVTRSADLLTLPLTSIPGWDATQGGVLVAAYEFSGPPLPASKYQVAASIFDVAGNNGVAIYPLYDGGFRALMYSGGGTQFATAGGSPPAAFVRRKTALGWSTTRGCRCDDGAVSVLNTGSYSLPVGSTSLEFGCSYAGEQLCGTLESVAYYKGERADAFVQRVSRG